MLLLITSVADQRLSLRLLHERLVDEELRLGRRRPSHHPGSGLAQGNARAATVRPQRPREALQHAKVPLEGVQVARGDARGKGLGVLVGVGGLVGGRGLALPQLGTGVQLPVATQQQGTLRIEEYNDFKSSREHRTLMI